MSKSKNVHPGHYKTRGSLRQGEDVVHHEEREKLGRETAQDEKSRPRVSSKTGKKAAHKPSRKGESEKAGE